MRVLLVDVGTDLADSAARIWPEVEALKNTSVADVPAAPGTAFVSPCNSHLFMDGGVDRVYSTEMFPGIEGLARSALRDIGIPDRMGGKYLPIGQAIKVGDVIFSPTMLKPQDVSQTRNAFLSMNAALWCAFRHGVETLVVPGMCTGWGRMSADRAVSQMKDAHDLFTSGEHHGVCAVAVLEEQPKFYENTEFVAIPPHEIVHQA